MSKAGKPRNTNNREGFIKLNYLTILSATSLVLTPASLPLLTPPPVVNVKGGTITVSIRRNYDYHNSGTNCEPCVWAAV